ncbi:MAG: endo-1,4-beta-xylanase [Lachnospiraceae bacterium]|nr:endo-1,4-beta-xylanase [Lachnospiraceae bacterium]
MVRKRLLKLFSAVVISTMVMNMACPMIASAEEVVKTDSEEGTAAEAETGEEKPEEVAVESTDANEEAETVLGEEETKEKKEIERDIPDLRDYVSSDEGIGADGYTGTAIMVSEITDETLMDIVEKHFNAVTFGNELKPDALFNYNNDKPADGMIVKETWTDAKGIEHKDMDVPTLDFSRAESMLKVIKEWNDNNPDKQIKVRGHVLTWHSQTPAWFFKENYDPNGELVSPEEMTIRHEWFIKSVYEHIFNSEYKDMFYGWDVVNEACSDETGTYRSGAEKSNWAKIYGTGNKEDAPEYILNAFRFANYYASEMGQDDLELYYNDYNECSGSKPDAIAGLLSSVKKHESDSELPTRISGVGMQGHYTIDSPTKQQIIDCGTRYGKIVGKVQVTELDIKASAEYDGTEATEGKEYTKQAYRFKDIYDALRIIDQDPNIDVNNITLWGVIDPNSWLQSRNDVGGASDGTKKQCPLLFDGDYKAKPAYWAFVDTKKLEPKIKNITISAKSEGEDAFAHAKTYTIDDTDYSFMPVWDEGKLYVKVNAAGADSAKIYVDWSQSMQDGADIESSESAIDGSESCVLEVGSSDKLAATAAFSMDVVVSDDAGSYAFNNLQMSQDDGSKYYAKAICKPYMNITKGTPAIDGEIDDAWKNAEEIDLSVKGGSPKASAKAKLLWDEKNLYVLMNVKDSNLDATSDAAHEKDSVEVFIDENNHKSDSYEEDDKQYRVNYLNETSFNGSKCIEDNIEHAVSKTDDGYIVEAAYAWTDVTPEVGTAIGIDMQINDAEGGSRIGTASWYDETGNGWSSPKVFGEATLADKKEEKEEKEVEKIDILFAHISWHSERCGSYVPKVTYRVMSKATAKALGVKRGTKLVLEEGKDYTVETVRKGFFGISGIYRINGIGAFKGSKNVVRFSL